MASDTTTVAYLFVRKYTDRAMSDAATRDHVLSRKMKMELGLTGEDWRYFVRYGNPTSVGGTFSTTQGDRNNSKGVQFATTPALKYGVIEIDGPSMARAGSKGAKVDLATNEIDSVLEEQYDHLAFDMYRGGDGIRGRRSSIDSDTVTLTNPEDARNFKVGMPIGASSSSDGSSPRTGDTTVARVDEDAGTVELTDESLIQSFADNDYLFIPGDPGTCMEGLEAIIPLTAPSSGESFRGQDRSVHTRLLAGVRVDNTSAPIEENLGLVGVKISQARRNQGKLMAFVDPLNFWQVCRRRDAKVEYDGGGGTATVGFEFINVATPAGVIKLFSDPDCPSNRGFVGDMSVTCVKHSRPYVHVVNDDGKTAQRSSTADSIEVRTRSMGQPIIFDPSRWGVFSI